MGAARGQFSNFTYTGVGIRTGVTGYVVNQLTCSGVHGFGYDDSLDYKKRPYLLGKGGAITILPNRAEHIGLLGKRTISID
jgi:hypothetical protein